MSYKSTKPVKETNRKEQATGILQLFVVASIAYMAYIVILGVEGIEAKVMCIPALIWVAVILVNKFTK